MLHYLNIMIHIDPIPQMPNVLLVDDDTELLELLSDYLKGDGFAVETYNDSKAAVTASLSGKHDIVVLDIMMPGMTGIQALAKIRASSNIPVLMLTARGDDTDRIAGLELGADDYVPKPCTPRELAARIRAILKRVQASLSSTTTAIVIGDLSLRPSQRLAELNGEFLDLTSSEFSLLEVLARHAGNLVSKEALSQEALGRALSPYDRSIDVHISSIRHKLGPLADGRSRIQTVTRRGYLLIME